MFVVAALVTVALGARQTTSSLPGWAARPRAKDTTIRIQGPTFLIEYDNTQNSANHAHSVWRDFEGDFGRDLLAAHYRAYPHEPINAEE